MKSESKRILVEIQKKAINPITHKPSFRTPDEVLEEALDLLYRNLRSKKVL
jgi:ribosome maturation protein Sdo1